MSPLFSSDNHILPKGWKSWSGVTLGSWAAHAQQCTLVWWPRYSSSPSKMNMACWMKLWALPLPALAEIIHCSPAPMHTSGLKGIEMSITRVGRSAVGFRTGIAARNPDCLVLNPGLLYTLLGWRCAYIPEILPLPASESFKLLFKCRSLDLTPNSLRKDGSWYILTQGE